MRADVHIVAFPTRRSKALRAASAALDRGAELDSALAQLFDVVTADGCEAIMIADADGLVRYATPHVERIFGMPPAQLVNRPLDHLFSVEDAVQLGALRRDLVPSQAQTLGVNIRSGGGPALAAEATVRDMRAHPAIAGYVVTIRDISERHALERLLRDTAALDPLTGLGNRTVLLEQIAAAAGRTEASGMPHAVGLLIIDLDGFKAVNDSLGHRAGDLLLREVADRLSSALRPNDTLVRLGGDEFAAFLDPVGPMGAEVVAERMLARLRAPISVAGTAVVPVASIGVATGEARDVVAEELMRHADLALNSARSIGRGQYVMFEAGMRSDALEQVELEGELRRAIRAEEFVLHYQPIVNLPTGRVSGMEALIRWQHPERGLLPPAMFIRAAEDSHLINEIGRWVLHQACRDAAVWFAELGEDAPFVSVNVAVRQLEAPWLITEVQRALARTGLPAGKLVVEITESAVSGPSAGRTLAALGSMGIELAIDDFGTGWSSLDRLRDLPLDKLKIDRSFVSEIHNDGDDAPLVAAIIGMARSLGLGVVAEGVETAAQVRLLHALGCDELQGYYLARPLPRDAATALLTGTSFSHTRTLVADALRQVAPVILG